MKAINKNNRKTLIIAIIAAAVIAAAILSVMFGPRAVNWLGRIGSDPVSFDQNLTVINCNVGRAITDEDLREVEAIAIEIVGDRFVSAARTEGVAPAFDLSMSTACSEAQIMPLSNVFDSVR